MNARDRLHQIARCRARASTRGLARAQRGQLRHYAIHEFRLELWKLVIENLRHRPLDDLLEFLASHSQRTTLTTRVLRTEQYDTTLSADDTELVPDRIEYFGT